MGREHEFDEEYWRRHWQQTELSKALPVNPHLVEQIADLTPGTAVEAGCGEGTEAIWLAERGWQVTAVDLSPEALARAAARTRTTVEWVQADLTTWEPPALVDLVTTHYAHPSVPQLELYRRLAGWVTTGGSLLVVGHQPDAHGHEPATAQVTPGAVIDALGGAWRVDTATEAVRAVPGRDAPLHDVVVRATRVR